MGFLDKLKEAAEKAAERARSGAPGFDPGVFDDELATKTEWGPARAGGASFGTHRLKRRSPSRLEFAPGFGAYAMGLIFVVAGAGVGIGMTLGGLQGDTSMIFFGIPFGSIFFVAGIFITLHMTVPSVFDRSTERYWRGRKPPATRKGAKGAVEHCLLQDIHAIQLLSEYCSGSESSFTSYELNLVLKDATRLNVVDHGNLKTIREDGAQLAKYLNVPLWDAIDGTA